MNAKKILALALTIVLTVSLFAGCGAKPAASGSAAVSAAGSTEAGSTGTAPSGEIVPLKFYMMNSPVNEMDRIMEKANAIIEKEIGANLELVLVDSATYAEKMNLMINGGDAWDLCFAASWGGINFFENAAKGAYADLTELIPQYAPETYARIPEGMWDGVKVNGKIYGLVNYQQWGAAQRKGFRVRSDIAEKVGFDYKTLQGKTTIEALNLLGENYLSKAVPENKGMIGWETNATYSFFANEPLMWDMEPVGDMFTPGWVRFDKPETVINQFDTPEFKQYCDIMRDWYNKGYVRKDGATLQDASPDRKAAKLLAEPLSGWPDTILAEENGVENPDVYKMSMCTSDIAPAVGVSTTRTVIPAAAGSTAAVAINAKSENITKALELMELLNTNDDLFMLLTQGEKDVDYTFTETGEPKMIDGKFNFNYNEWQIGQSYSPDFARSLRPTGEAGEASNKCQSIVYEADKTAEVSPVTGFTFDSSKVKTELANCTAIMTEMVPALSNGSVDPAKALPDFLKRLESAGVSAIVAEKQAQYDAWKAANA